ncbi:cell division protein FtsZ [Brevibacillus formosus]|uniref:cell division protein FtsZ n=1 Tax=Brevibacillus formosus TaxID=54913 RepID=UPI001CA52C83|nr:cell division protein FtsZ [Brevibacillus formosus]MBW5471592.1 cell division protein FtsZ [Brevibacillus formosus]
MSFVNNKPSINMTIVGFGQAGTRMADCFAAIKDGQEYVYNTLALNSNDGDLQELKYVPRDSRVSLNLGGLGKNPTKAMAILENDEPVREKLKSFITQSIRPKDELVLFSAGLGGGTGTSTLIRALEEFYDFNNKPKIIEELKKIQAETSAADFKANLEKYKVQAFKRAQERFVKIGVVVTLPVRSDGPDVLRQVNEFADRIWRAAKNPAKGIAFVIFADNQYFYDRWKELGPNAKADNYRDYANREICNLIHELNTGTNGGGTSVTFDSQDFRRIILEGTGSLVISKASKKVEDIKSVHDLKGLFTSALDTNSLHDPIALQETDESGVTQFAKVHHVGLLGILDKQLNSMGSSFLDEAKNEIIEKLPLSGTVFSGYLQDKHDFRVSAYTFYKVEALPQRLAKGLVKEHEEFLQKQKAVSFREDSIAKIAVADDENLDLDLDLSELGIDMAEIEAAATKEEDEGIDLDNLNFDGIDLD